jgi:hypothetical protein
MKYLVVLALLVLLSIVALHVRAEDHPLAEISNGLGLSPTFPDFRVTTPSHTGGFFQ